ncbi:MAG TPA: hypothetical protein P5096_00815 [Patescibacteria group bacterium]|nr:hypothetical protein [Patescibacteria group bacterium]
MSKKLGRKVKRIKKSIKFKYVFVGTPDVEERMKNIFNIIFSEVVAKMRLKSQENKQGKL